MKNRQLNNGSGKAGMTSKTNDLGAINHSYDHVCKSYPEDIYVTAATTNYPLG